MQETITETLAANKNHLVIMLGDIEDLNSSDIEELLAAGKHLSHEALAYAAEELGLDLMDIRFYPGTDSWGF